MGAKTKRRRRALALGLWLAACGCGPGNIDSSGHPDNVPGLGAPGAEPFAAGEGGGVPPAQAAAAADDAMRAANPELFELSMQYFPGEVPTDAPGRLARLTRIQLDLTTAQLLPGAGVGSVLEVVPRDPLQTNYEYAENLGFNAANFTPYTSWVGEIAASVAANPTAVIDCAAAGDSSACLDAQARAFVRRAFRGVVSAAQLDRFAGFFLASVPEVGLARAIADLVDLTLTSPGYVFREEVLTDATGRMPVPQRLQALSYTLADAPPERLGLTVEGDGPMLDDDAGREQLVTRVLSTREARDKLMRFFLAWLEVREADELTIAPEVFPEFTPELAQAMVDETRAFLEHQLQAVAPSLLDVTQSTESFVSQAVAALYGTAAGTPGSLTPLDPAQRLGIFTQPGVIASHSGPATTRLVKRGVFFTRKVMCLPLGAPPAGVDTTVPQDAGNTERQRIEAVTAQTQCQGCHAYINPFGFMQENYDPLGRFRTSDEGFPIDASIDVAFLEEGPLTTSSPVEALRSITSSVRFQQCFARQLFRFYMGRDETPGDDPALRQMFFRFADGQRQDIVTMLETLGTSPLLTHRTEAP